MTTDIDICNMALSEIGSQTLITSIGEATPAGQQSELYYNQMRQKLLRTAPWGFARKTITLTELGTLAEGTSPYPWLVKYEYPSDCMKFRYIIPPPAFLVSDDVPDVSSGLIVPWCGPSRAFRFLPAIDTDGDTPTPNVVKVLLSNVPSAYGVYTVDVEDPNLWEPLFVDALVMLLAYKFVMPLAGNAGMKSDYFKLAEAAVLSARAVDGNEAIPSTDHETDWITVRGTPPIYSGIGNGFTLGSFFGGYDNLGWGM